MLDLSPWTMRQEEDTILFIYHGIFTMGLNLDNENNYILMPCSYNNQSICMHAFCMENHLNMKDAQEKYMFPLYIHNKISYMHLVKSNAIITTKITSYIHTSKHTHLNIVKYEKCMRGDYHINFSSIFSC